MANCNDVTLQFKLTQKAKSNGGDKYEADVVGEARPMVVYIPQSISRVGGQPVVSMTVIFRTN